MAVYMSVGVLERESKKMLRKGVFFGAARREHVSLCTLHLPKASEASPSAVNPTKLAAFWNAVTSS